VGNFDLNGCTIQQVSDLKYNPKIVKHKRPHLENYWEFLDEVKTSELSESRAKTY